MQVAQDIADLVSPSKHLRLRKLALPLNNLLQILATYKVHRQVVATLITKMAVDAGNARMRELLEHRRFGVETVNRLRALFRVGELVEHLLDRIDLARVVNTLVNGTLPALFDHPRDHIAPLVAGGVVIQHNVVPAVLAVPRMAQVRPMTLRAENLRDLGHSAPNWVGRGRLCPKCTDVPSHQVASSVAQL